MVSATKRRLAIYLFSRYYIYAILSSNFTLGSSVQANIVLKTKTKLLQYNQLAGLVENLHGDNQVLLNSITRSNMPRGNPL